MLDSYNQSQIETISYQLLKRSKAYGVFPTPVERIVKEADLVIAKNIDLSNVKSSFLDRMTDGAKSIVREIRGVLDRREKVIYLDLSVGEAKKTFVTLHETGHEMMPWQQEILQCLDDDQTLSPFVLEEFEAEANFFASLTLFQHDVFDEQMKKLQLGIPAAKVLAKTFGSSVHAALRRYVERNPKRVALLVLENPTSFPFFSCCVKSYFQSDSFTATFGDLNWGNELSIDQNYSFLELYSFKKRWSEDGEVSVTTSNGDSTFKYHYFNNTYNAFVLLFPEGENKSTRTKIIVTGTEL